MPETPEATPLGRTIAWLDEEVNPHKTAGVRDLGRVGLGSLREEVLSAPADAWDSSGDFDANYNKRAGALRSTAHIVLRFCDRRRRPAPCYDRPAWSRWEPLVLPVMRAAVAPFGYARGFFPRIMFARLPAGAFIVPHEDGDARGTRPHKIHVPIVTNARAGFFVGEERHHFEEGRAYEINNTARHAAVNAGATDRIHLVFEYLDVDAQPSGLYPSGG